ncbi:J domain-containing protein [Cryptosporidium felis]|nr:J domain-containing protein [Cryptosporidium felis]
MEYNFQKFYDAFKLLGLEVGANFSEIKSSYRRIAKRIHPDKNRGKGERQAHENFTILRDAYVLLCDEAGRKQFEAVYEEFFTKRSNALNNSFKGSSRAGSSLKTDDFGTRNKERKWIHNQQKNLSALRKETMKVANTYIDNLEPITIEKKPICRDPNRSARRALKNTAAEEIINNFSIFESAVIRKLKILAEINISMK